MSGEGDPQIMTVKTGVTSGGQNQRDYNYVGTFPGIMGKSGLPVYGSPAFKQAVSYANGVTAPWATRPIVFKV
jgi:hypothetical protein